MSGILDKKKRIIDFSLTSNGYKQIQNGDLRFVYATLTDKHAIYDRKEGEIDVADLNAMPFFFETQNIYSDLFNFELDLNVNELLNVNTIINGKIINFDDINNFTDFSINGVNYSLNSLADLVSFNLVDNLKNQNILLTNNVLNQNNIDQISAYISKINTNNYNNLNQQSLPKANNDTDFINIKCRNDVENYFSICNVNALDLNRYSMLEDDRFMNKINYLFLSPVDSNQNKIIQNNLMSRNTKIKNTFNLYEDKRKMSKILIKNDLISSLSNINESYEKNVIRQIKNLKDFINILDTLAIEYSGLNFRSETNSKLEITLENTEYEYDFLFDLFQISTNTNTQNNLEKLLFINHGELFDDETQKNYQIYSAGKLFSSKTEIDLDNDPTNNLINGEYIIEDNYLFVNLFTIIIE